MQRTMIVAAALLLITMATWASEVLPDAEAWGGLTLLSSLELEEVEGEALYLGVDRVGKSMTVTSVVPGDYSRIECYTVGVTTDVVRNSDTNLAKGAMVNTNKTIVASNGVPYNPTQIANGTYGLSGTKSNVAGYGTGIKIDYTQTTGGLKGATAVSSDFFVHGTPVDNTNGCIGVKNGSMNKVLNTYQNSVGPKTVSVFNVFTSFFGLKR